MGIKYPGLHCSHPSLPFLLTLISMALFIIIIAASIYLYIDFWLACG